jgi:hypothetical protein
MTKPTGIQFYDKNGKALKCETDGCRKPRPKGAAFCPSCTMLYKELNAKLAAKR